MKILQLINNQRPLEYLDPGSGSILVQMIIAALAGVAVTIGIFGKKLKRWWLKLLRKEVGDGEDFDFKE